MPDPLSQQAVSEALQAQKIHRLAQRVVARHKLLENDPARKEFEDRAIEIIRWMRWDCIKWLQDNGNQGEKPGQYCHTSKPFTDAMDSADGFVGNAFGEDNWVSAEMEEDALNEIDQVQAWTQQISQWLVNHYRFGTWMLIQPPITLDTLTFGNSLTYTGRKDRDIYHRKCHILDAYLKRGFDMLLSQVHYLEPYQAGEAYEIWGDKLSEATCRLAVQNPTQRVTMIRCVYPVTDKIFADTPVNMQDEWTHYELVVEKDSLKNTDAYGSEDPFCGILEHAGYVENPFTDWPYWLPGTEDAYGWSAYGAALISIKRLHAAYKGLTNAVQRATDAPMKTMRHLKNRIDLRPGHMSYLDNPTDVLEEVYHSATQYPLTIDFLQDMEQELERVGHLDLYRAMSLRDKEMTVPEVLEVIGEKARQLAPRIGTRQLLYDNPTHDRTLSLAKVMGLGPVVENRHPDGLKELITQHQLSSKLRMVYRGPLAAMNDMVMLSRKVQNTIGLLGLVAGIGEKAAAQVQDSLKADVLAETILDHSDLTQNAIATEKEKQKAQRERAQALQMQMAQMAMDTAKTATEGDKNMMETARAAGR